MQSTKPFYELKGEIQPYQWGGNTFLAHLLQVDNAAQKPLAEYWLGAHAQAPAQVDKEGDLLPMDQFLKQYPEWLGTPVKQQFGRLPYLLKVLDVEDMLSIQVHPNKAAAEVAYAREEAAGIPRTAAHRNYKDDNHKPELMVALSEFWLLHGFRAPESMRAILQSVSQLHFLLPIFESGGYRTLYETVMQMSQDEVNSRLRPLLASIVPLYEGDELEQGHPDYWAAKAALTFRSENGDVDRGIFSVYLLNLVQLQPGEAIFQDAGILHAYLYGQNVEIMANSDNVLRGGLTPKHIDVPELLQHVVFDPVIPEVIQAKHKNAVEKVYASPAPDFQLSVLDMPVGQVYVASPHTAEIFLVMNGKVSLHRAGGDCHRKRGEAFLGRAGAHIQIRAEDHAIVYRASVPFPQ
jgi:mannose-6-phosphate isomerase